MVGEHPARLASQRSMRCAERKAKEEWLALYTDDAILEDPVGSSPLDPEGRGHQGKEALHVFWDTNIANSGTKFTIKESYAAGNEVANVGRIDLTLADGSTAICDGVFVYKVNDEGKIVSLRTFWEFDKMMATIKSASGS